MRYEIEQQIDTSILKELIDEHDLGFIFDTLEYIHNEKDSLMLYPNAKEEISRALGVPWHGVSA